MTLTIGRVSIVQNPSQLELDGDRLDIAGWFFGTDLNNAKVIREQLLGLDANEDEPDVPVTWTFDAKVDGYYTVKSVAVSHIIGVAYPKFKFQYAMQLERVQGGFVLPLTEVAATNAVRTNGVGVIAGAGTCIGHVWIPFAGSFRSARFPNGEISGVTYSAGVLRTADTGQVAVAQCFPGLSPTMLAVTAALPPADYYDGSALIEQSVGGVWYPVVGNQIGNVVGNLMRIGNGLVRATFHTDGVITSEIFDGTVWESSTSFSLMNSGTTIWLAEGGWKILRNDPAACSIKTSAQYNPAGGTGLPASVTIHIERGKMLFELYVDNMFWPIDQASDLAETLQLRANTVTAATAITGGIRQTSNNAQGHRWFLLSPSAVTNDLVNGRITIAAQSAPLIAQFGVGWEFNGSSAATINTAANQAIYYFGAMGTRQRVVSK